MIFRSPLSPVRGVEQLVDDLVGIALEPHLELGHAAVHVTHNRARTEIEAAGERGDEQEAKAITTQAMMAPSWTVEIAGRTAISSTGSATPGEDG